MFVVDGVSSEPLDKVNCKDDRMLKFSPNSKHFAVLVEDAEGAWILVDGKRMPFDSDYIPYYVEFTFSPHGGHFAYQTGRVDKKRMYLDGKPILVLKYVLLEKFGKNGEHFAYWTSLENGQQSQLIIDGKSQMTLSPTEHVDSIVFNSDGKHVAYRVQDRKADTYQIVTDGKRGKKYHYCSSPVFLTDGTLVEYIAFEQGKRYHVEGEIETTTENWTEKEHKLCEECDASGRHYVRLGWLSNDTLSAVYLDGIMGDAYDKIAQGHVFRPDGSMEYLAIRDGSLYRVLHRARAQ